VDGVAPARRIRFLRFFDAQQLLCLLLTGTHAVHLMGGVLALFGASIAALISQGRGDAQHRD